MKLNKGTILHGDELDKFNAHLNRSYSRAEVLWVDTDANPQAQVRVTSANTGQQQVITVPAEIPDEEAETEPAEPAHEDTEPNDGDK